MSAQSQRSRDDRGDRVDSGSAPKTVRGRARGGVTRDETDRVIEIETKRQAMGYGLGWTYFRARDERLLLAFEHTLGRYSGGAEKGYAPVRGRPLRDPEPALSVELTPRSCYFKSVRSGVSASTWEIVKDAVGERCGGQCEACGGRGRKYAVGCHGVFEYDELNRRQILIGVAALCPGCAECRYLGLASLRGRYEIAYRRLLMVNRWTTMDADRHVARAEALFERRSEIEWVQDFSLIQEPDVGVASTESYLGEVSS